MDGGYQRFVVREKGERTTFMEKMEMFDEKGHHPIVSLSYSSLCVKEVYGFPKQDGGRGAWGLT